MTNKALQRLKPGTVLIRRGVRRTPRVLLYVGRVVALLKIGRSWTDPRATAYYDAAHIRQEYRATDRRVRISNYQLRRLLSTKERDRGYRPRLKTRP